MHVSQHITFMKYGIIRQTNSRLKNGIRIFFLSKMNELKTKPYSGNQRTSSDNRVPLTRVHISQHFHQPVMYSEYTHQ